MSDLDERKYYHRINNLDIALEETNHKYIMINQWAIDNSYKWGIAVFNCDDEGFWNVEIFRKFDLKVDWYDFGCLVNLGYKWIKELGWE